MGGRRVRGGGGGDAKEMVPVLLTIGGGEPLGKKRNPVPANRQEILKIPGIKLSVRRGALSYPGPCKETEPLVTD